MKAPGRCGGVSGMFSLVEMLVVIAIIGILAALLMPSLQKAVQAARGSLCQSNIRQVGMAMLAYADDNGGWGASTHYSHYLMGPVYASKAQHTLVPYLGDAGVPASAPSLLQYDVLPVALCPCGRRDATGSLTVGADFNTPNGSYGFTVYLTSGPGSAYLPRFGKITQVRRPANRILCADVGGANSGSRPAALFRNDQFAYRHDGGNNLCHVDNHVKLYSYAESLGLGTGSNPSPEGIWHDLH